MMDMVLRSDRRMVDTLEIEGTNYFHSSLVVPGGSGNVVAALSHLGGRAALIGKAGQDVYGRAYLQDLRALKISAEVEFDESSATGFAVCLVEPDGRRTMLVSRGANDNLTQEEVRKRFRLLGPAKFVYLSGYSLLNMPQRAAVLEAGRIGRANGSQVVFDPGSANLIKGLSGVFEVAVDSCDILCANLAESRVLAEGLDVPEYARLLSRRGKSVIIKTGPRGCLVSSRGEFSTVQGVDVRVVDTTGAGDAFLGALLYCLSQDYSLFQAASFANWFAARKIEGLGPRHFPSRSDAGEQLKLVRQSEILETRQKLS